MSAASRQAARSYQDVALQETAGEYHLLLDGAPARTPAGAALQVPTLALGEAIRNEFAAQGEKLDPLSMPLTALLCAAIDRTAPQREAVIEAILPYAETDLLCYRDPDQPELHALQQKEWGRVLDWAETALGISLQSAAGVMPVAQPAQAMEKLRGALSMQDAARLTAIGALAQAMGSLILALALSETVVSAEEATRLALLEEDYQAQRWGRDEIAEQRRGSIAREIKIGEKFLNLLAK